MKRINRRHKNPTAREENKTPFFSKTTESSTLSEKNKNSFFQTKLTIGRKEDPEEKEADIAAKNIVNKAPQENMEEEAVQSKRNIQKQEVPEEEEAVQAKRNIQKQEVPEEEETVQAKRNIQKQEEEEEPVQAKIEIQKQAEEEEETVQTKPDKTDPQKRQDILSNLNNTKGEGSALPENIMDSMGSAFGVDFSDVRIHTNKNAVQMNKELHSQAFTHGKDIYFNEGKYKPETSAGKQLLAHELTHVVQQNI